MKLSKIHIKKWHQFEDLELDLTYPQDYKEEKLRGEPLKKVCFIGPSGSGKTKLLELIYKFYSDINLPYSITGSSNSSFDIDFYFSAGNENFKYNCKSEIIEGVQSRKHLTRYANGKKWYANAQSPDIEIFPSGFPDDNIQNYSKDNNQKSIYSKLLTSFSTDSNQMQRFGFTIPKDAKFLEINDSISTSIKETLLALKFDDFQKKEKNLESRNFEDIMSKLEIILKLQNIKFDSIFTASYFDLLFTNGNGDIFSINDLSSGTKQIIYRYLPIFYINPSNSVIIIDEPEVSLFPDIQKNIVDFIIGSKENSNQFFFATHSPLVAAQFEKEEIFILDFDENGKVQVRKPEENPNYLDLEGATETLFPGVKPKEPMHETGVIKLKELKKLTRQIRDAERKEDKTTIEELYPKYEQLADELNAYRYYPEYTLLYENNNKNR